ncbi:Clr5 domain-containing protein [Ilyonectria sp. MPI-CAGE-AT-0026]|nr:Clr5 domain-containing protein [Ilyonectria sp. MPI-CAGE-AT-0026]
MSLVPSSIQVPCRSVQGPSPTTWAKYRETITRLYIREDKSLAEIMDIMARHHGLHATERMYKFRIKCWNLNKSLRPEEVLAMARVKSRRQATGVGADFWRYGRPVTAAKLERYLRDHPHTATQLKKHVPEDALLKGHIEALLPPHIIVLTPSRPLRLDDDIHSLEALMVSLDYYTKAEFSVHGNSAAVTGDGGFWSHMGLLSSGCLSSAVSLLDKEDVPPKHWRVVNSMLQLVFDELRSAIHIGHPGLFWGVIYRYAQSDRYRPEIATLWLTLARDVCAAVKGSSHPLSRTFSMLLNWRGSPMQSRAIRTLCSVTGSSLSQHVTQDDPWEMYAKHCSWDIFDVIDNELVPSGERTAFNEEYWTKHMETTLQTEEAIKAVIALVQFQSHEDLKCVLSWLEEHQWQETTWWTVNERFEMAAAYLKAGEANVSFDIVQLTFDSIVEDWRSGFSIHDTLVDVMDLESVLEALPEGMYDLDNLKDHMTMVLGQIIEELDRDLPEVLLSELDWE